MADNRIYNLCNNENIVSMKTAELPELMTPKEASEYLRTPLPTIYYLLRRGQLPAIQIGGRWRIKRSWLDADVLRLESKDKPIAAVLIEENSVWMAVRGMLAACGYAIDDVGCAAADLIIVSPDSLDLFPVARKWSPEATICLLWGEPCPETLRTLLQYGPVTLLHHPVTLESIQKLAAMFKVEPVALAS